MISRLFEESKCNRNIGDEIEQARDSSYINHIQTPIKTIEDFKELEKQVIEPGIKRQLVRQTMERKYIIPEGRY